MVGNKGRLRRMLQVYLTVGQILRAASPTADFAKFGRENLPREGASAGFYRAKFLAGRMLGRVGGLHAGERRAWGGTPSRPRKGVVFGVVVT